MAVNRGVWPVVLTVRRGTHLVRTGFRHVPAQRRLQALPVVGVDPGIVPPTRQRHIREALIHQALPGAFAIDVEEHPVGGEPLAAMARDGIAMIDMPVRARTLAGRVTGKRDGLPGVGADAQVVL